LAKKSLGNLNKILLKIENYQQSRSCFPDSNESNNIWTAAKGILERYYFRWLSRYFSTVKAPMKITFTEE
jgi:hypothetical protein